ncbi:hypothetical protein FOMPIDRAFT_1063540 [Fomitopsis schrenkii]|uniref:AB hydrolase-1 domain-containing protein n=1 Tax=Fomitopsis schrenkii TaxID=2126942 RepID=S8DIM1_FOMSC|nr:hypothetical protein FOMPIDRAFT_1063540 [Fomitopsis schrenkii]
MKHAARDGRVKVRDAWAIDCPNHGDAAVLNERTLSQLGGVRARRAPLPQRGVPGRRGRLHQAQPCRDTQWAPSHSASIILVPFPKDSMPPILTNSLTGSTEKRRDVFPSREEALAWLQSRAGFKATSRDNCNTGRVRGYNYLPTLCAARSVHVGAGDDYIPREVKDRLLKEGMLDRYASVRRVPGAGHLVVQTHPRGLADVIWDILSGQSTQEGSRNTRL